MKYITLIILLICTACTKTYLSKLPTLKNSQKAELYVYRKSSFAAGGSKAIFGFNMQNYVVLGNQDYSKLELSPNSYDFFVQDKPAMDAISIKANPYNKKITLKNGDKKCLMIYPNQKKIAIDAIADIPSYAGSIFILEEIECQEKESIVDDKEYVIKPVEYNSK